MQAAGFTPSRQRWERIGAVWRGGRPRLDVKRARFVVRKFPRSWRGEEISKLLKNWLPDDGVTGGDAYSLAAEAWRTFECRADDVDAVRVGPGPEYGDWRGMHAATSDDAIEDTARRCARWCRRECEGLCSGAGRVIRGFIHAWGMGEAEGIPQETCPMVARAITAKWWRRKLRVIRGRCTERAALALGLLGAGKQKYVSDVGLRAQRYHDKKTMKMLRETHLKNDAGDECTLFDAWRAGVANPRNRLNELVTRIKGHEACADARGDVGVFVTNTCPSRFHSMRYKAGQNDRWDGSTPRESQIYQRKWWAQCRKRLSEAGIDYHGMRVAEPHHDGTAHWHLLIWCGPGQVADMLGVLNWESLREAPLPGEPVAYRFKSESIDRSKGDACSYVMKYICKNIVVDDDATPSVLIRVADNELNQTMFHIGTDGNQNSKRKKNVDDRASVWARRWGIRQFQFFGSAPVTLWRFIRRMKLSAFDEAVREVVAQFHRVGDRAADFSVFLREARACAGRFGVASVGLGLVRAHTDAVNQYGEPRLAVPIGIDTAIGCVYHDFRARWRVDSRGVRGSRTRLNNCPAGGVREGANPSAGHQNNTT